MDDDSTSPAICQEVIALGYVLFGSLWKPGRALVLVVRKHLAHDTHLHDRRLLPVDGNFLRNGNALRTFVGLKRGPRVGGRGRPRPARGGVGGGGGRRRVHLPEVALEAVRRAEPLFFGRAQLADVFSLQVRSVNLVTLQRLGGAAPCRRRGGSSRAS